MKLDNFFNLNEQTTGQPIFSATTTGVTISNFDGNQKQDILNMAKGLRQNPNANTNILEFLPDVTNWPDVKEGSIMYKFQQEFNKKYSKNTQNTLNLSGKTNVSGGPTLASQMLTAAVGGAVAEEIKRIKKLL
jgi:hypothetical protein